jgi:uncharacterized RDD family membrane protein YckC
MAHDAQAVLPARIYGTFWQRAGAAGFDAMLLHAVWMGVNALQPGETALWISMLVTPLTWIYNVGTVALWGQTVGKMFTGIQITRTDFKPVGLGRALLREAVAIALSCVFILYELHLISVIPKEIIQAVPFKYVAAFGSHFAPRHNVILFAWPIGVWQVAELVTMLFHPKRRAIHDLIAGTVVVQTYSAVAGGEAHRGLRVAPGLLWWMLLWALQSRGAGKPYRSHFPNGALKGEYVPWTAGATKLTVYWGNGTVRHVLSESHVKDSRPRRIDKTWQSFDESGRLTRDIQF